LLQNRNQPAAAVLERAIQSGATSADAHFNLALARARLGDVGAAVRACREALLIRPGMAKALELLAELGR
jgi:Flp pilus assembly protein TadD